MLRPRLTNEEVLLWRFLYVGLIEDPDAVLYDLSGGLDGNKILALCDARVLGVTWGSEATWFRLDWIDPIYSIEELLEVANVSTDEV
jgi:hypothetical protein